MSVTEQECVGADANRPPHYSYDEIKETPGISRSEGWRTTL
jgi:hypothetical protein